MADKPISRSQRKLAQAVCDHATPTAISSCASAPSPLEQKTVQGTEPAQSSGDFPARHAQPEQPTKIIHTNQEAELASEESRANDYTYVQIGSEVYALKKDAPSSKRRRGRRRRRQPLQVEIVNLDGQELTKEQKLARNLGQQGELSPLTLELLASRVTPQGKRSKRALSLKRNHQRSTSDVLFKHIQRLEKQDQLSQEIQTLLKDNPKLRKLRITKSSRRVKNLVSQPPTPATAPSFTRSESDRLPALADSDLCSDGCFTECSTPEPVFLAPAPEQQVINDRLEAALLRTQQRLLALGITMQESVPPALPNLTPNPQDSVIYINKVPHRLVGEQQYEPLDSLTPQAKSSQEQTQSESRKLIPIRLSQKEAQLTRPLVKSNQTRGEITHLGIYQRSDKEQQHLEQLLEYYKLVYPNLQHQELLEYLGSANVTYRSLAVHVQHYKEFLAAQKLEQENQRWQETREYSRLLGLKSYYLCTHGLQAQPTLAELVALEQDSTYQQVVQGIARLQLANPVFPQLAITPSELEEFVALSPNPPEPSYDTRALPLEIVYQDEHLVVANKPYGMLSVPGFIEDSVETRVREMFGYAQAAHRLDMATSGLIIIAITPEADAAIKAQFREREMEKIYVAMVDNCPPYEHSFIEAPLACDWEVRPRQRIDYNLGRPSLTEYKLLSYDPHANVSMVQLIPHTGRTHQLRVHLESIGCPIVGDKFYNTNYLKKPYHRMCLHASYLAFNHPITGEYLQLTALRDFELDLQVPDYCENPIVTRLYIDADPQPNLGFINRHNIDHYCEDAPKPNAQLLARTMHNRQFSANRKLEPWQLKEDWHYDLAHYLKMQVQPQEVSHATLATENRSLRQLLNLPVATEYLLRRAYRHAYHVVQKYYDRLPIPRLRYPVPRPTNKTRVAQRKD